MALHFFTWGKGTERRLYGAQRVVQTSVPVQANAFHIQCHAMPLPSMVNVVQKGHLLTLRKMAAGETAKGSFTLHMCA